MRIASFRKATLVDLLRAYSAKHGECEEAGFDGPGTTDLHEPSLIFIIDEAQDTYYDTKHQGNLQTGLIEASALGSVHGSASQFSTLR